MLPLDVARCVGQWANIGNAGMYFALAEQCQDCQRRTDRPAGVLLSFMVPPSGDPCPKRLEGDHA